MSTLLMRVNQVTGDLWERYLQLIDSGVPDGFVEYLITSIFSRVLTIYSDAMDQLGLRRYCCRRMVMTHVDLIEKLLK